MKRFGIGVDARSTAYFLVALVAIWAVLRYGLDVERAHWIVLGVGGTMLLAAVIAGAGDRGR